MKTLILYATKYGAAEKAAKQIAEIIGSAESVKLERGGVYPLDDYDCVVVGSSVYAGRIRKEAAEYIGKCSDELKKNKFGLFLCGMDLSGENRYFTTNFAPEILESAVATGFFGGIFDPAKANGIERLIMKIVSKQSGYVDNLSKGKIEDFALKLKSDR